MPALAAHRLGDQEVLDLEIVEAGRVELHELHVRDAAAGAPRHGDAVAGRAARSGRIEIGAARAAGGEDGRPRGQRLDPLLAAVVGIEPVDRAAGREIRRVAAGDQVDRDHVGDERDVGMLGAPPSRAPAAPPQPVASATWTIRRWLWPPSRVRCSAPSPRSRTARRARSAGRSRAGAASTTCSTTSRSLRPAPAIIVSLTCASKLSPSSSTAAIPPCAQPVAPSPSSPLAITATLRVLGEVERRGQPGRARADDEDVVAVELMRPRSRDQAQEHVLEVGVAGRDVDDRRARRAASAASTSPALTLSLR